MNNTFEYYKRTGEMLDFFEKNLQDLNFNFTKIEQKFKKDRGLPNLKNELDDGSSFFNLANTALVGLNREKIENAVETNWDNYKPEIYSSVPRPYFSHSKIPYFKEWFSVITCKEKYKTESSKFWIKKIRDVLMHANFEIDFSSNDMINGLKLKVQENSKNALVFDARISEFGFNEFVEDNFTNILKDEAGIVAEEISSLFAKQNHISTRDELKTFLSKMIIVKRTVKNNVVYDGNNKIDKETGETLKGKNKEVIDKFGVKIHFSGEGYFDNQNAQYFSLSEKAIETMIHVLEKKQFYASSSQTHLIHDVFAEYILMTDSIYTNIDSFKHLFEQLTFEDKMNSEERKKIKVNMATMFKHYPTRNAALTVMRLYRMLYAVQNPSFPKIDFGDVDITKFHLMSNSKDKFFERAEKKFEESNQQNLSVMNEITFDVIRNSLSHGNLKFANHVVDGSLQTVFVFSDVWKNRRTGIEENVTIYAPMEEVKKMLKEVDEKIAASIISPKAKEEIGKPKIKFDLNKLQDSADDISF